LTGIINLDKPPGITSAAAYNRVKRLLPRGTKIGHAGTLDPFATGVLLLLIGKATKLCETLMGQPKEYTATLTLGATTATDDLDSPEIPYPGAIDPLEDAARKAAATMVGTILQRPPAFSAMKIAGRRAYDLAREGTPVELKPRPVRIDSIEILSYQYPTVKIHVACGRGTYIRSIARDLGELLHTGAYLSELRRTRVGAFKIDEAVPLDTLLQTGVEPYLREMPTGL
jgi:tRNA pseudouridine55 synthase